MITALAVHPVLAASVVVLVIIAYLMKTRKRHYFIAHYTVGILAFSLFAAAFPIGIYEVTTSGGLDEFPTTLVFHLANFFIAASLITAQSVMGISMLLFGRNRKLVAVHRRVSKYVLVIVLLQGVLGLAVFIGILPYIFT